MALFLALALAGSSGVWSEETQVDLNAPVVLDDEHDFPLAAIEAFLESGPKGARQKLLSNPERLREIIHQLYLYRYMAEQARRADLLADPVEKARLENSVDRHLAGLFIAHSLKAPVPDMTEAARERYLANREDYQSDEKVRVSHILIRQSRDAEMDVGAFAKSIRARALAGEDFEQLAVEFSEDPSVAKNRGDLGLRAKPELEERFAEGAFGLKEIGEISPLVRTGYGFHIIKLLEREPVRQMTFDEAKAQIIVTLEAEYRQERHEAYLEKLKAEANYRIDDEVLRPYVEDKLKKLETEPEPSE
ncbi:MAG: peptidylprolyl isomerase [Pseudomonadota bacterium]|nr:peptidylprolyl isomerase [Pseudomonadota bacterium]